MKIIIISFVIFAYGGFMFLLGYIKGENSIFFKIKRGLGLSLHYKIGEIPLIESETFLKAMGLL